MKQPKTIKFGKDILTVTKKTSLGSIEKLTGKMYVHPMFLKLDKKIMELVVMNMKFMRKFDGDLTLSDNFTMKKLKRLYPKITTEWWIWQWGSLLLRTAPTEITHTRLKNLIDNLASKRLDKGVRNFADGGELSNDSANCLPHVENVRNLTKKQTFIIGNPNPQPPPPRGTMTFGRKPTKKEIAQWESKSDAPSLDKKTVKKLSEISKRISKSPKVNNGRNY